MERAIQDLSIVAMRHPVKNRDAVLRVNIANRQKMPTYDNKEKWSVFEAGIPIEQPQHRGI